MNPGTGIYGCRDRRCRTRHARGVRLKTTDVDSTTWQTRIVQCAERRKRERVMWWRTAKRKDEMPFHVVAMRMTIDDCLSRPRGHLSLATLTKDSARSRSSAVLLQRIDNKNAMEMRRASDIWWTQEDRSRFTFQLFKQIMNSVSRNHIFLCGVYNRSRRKLTNKAGFILVDFKMQVLDWLLQRTCDQLATNIESAL